MSPEVPRERKENGRRQHSSRDAKAWFWGMGLTFRNVNCLSVGRLAVKGFVNVSHEHDQRWVEPEGLLHAPVQEIHLGKNLVVQLLSVLFHDLSLLLENLGQEFRPVLLGKEVETRPCGRNARGVLAREESGDQHPGDLVHCHLPPPVGLRVPSLHKRLEDVLLLCRASGLRPPVLDDLGEDVAHLLARHVPVAVRLDRQVRKQHGNGLHSHIQKVKLKFSSDGDEGIELASQFPRAAMADVSERRAIGAGAGRPDIA